MPKMIELRDSNYVDANLVFQVEVIDKSVAVYLGRDVRNSDKRVNVPCATKEEAVAVAAKIVDEIEFAMREPAPYSAILDALSKPAAASEAMTSGNLSMAAPADASPGPAKDAPKPEQGKKK